MVNLKPTAKEVIQLFPEVLPYYKEVVLAMVKNDPYIRHYLPKKYQDDLDVKIMTLEQNLEKRKYKKGRRKKLESYLKELKSKRAMKNER